MKCVAGFLATLIFANVALAQGPGPTFSFVRSTDPKKGLAILVRFVNAIEQVPVRFKVVDNGKVVERVKLATRVQPREYDAYYDLATARVITTDGKQLPIDEVWKRLKKNTVVAISGNFDTPAPMFLRALHPDTLVIIPAPPKKEEPKPK